ncbi:DUF397 domain-containing protein [Streptomyces sp. ISL-99]|uniref:DUF397 domain-containing protein n=1 Tax=Streptomyces sp. ISL-99 TaxID=2819193 RepID=UPI001BEBCFA6|nr:DUF397 domain-containing protein [Streptomyces sp. ISL-99]MBT2528120.1 DUF397 domain-containing protein [Streptomyces sp. ISL-99]
MPSTTTDWQKSSFSGTGDDNNCVEIAASGADVHLRESDEPSAVLTTVPAGLRSLIAAIKTGAA